MRKLASFEDPERARALSEALFAQRIDSDVREDEQGERGVWVLSERDLPRAEAVLRVFLSHGARATHPRPSLFARARQSPVTYALIAICVLVSVATELLHYDVLLVYLSIASFDPSGNLWHDLAHGQLWRAITPIFIHFGPFHLIFNAFWLMDAGSVVERYQGWLGYTVFVLWSAALSNVAQLALGANPNFGGMSGVVYAYIGYLWARGRDPDSGIQVPGRLIGFFVVWMALGFSGLLDRVIGPMANYCHLGGFVAGLAYGYIAAVRARRRAQAPGVW